MSTYAIGDIQGCFEELQQLLKLIDFDPAMDELWFTGDLINRGPHNLQTVEFIMSLPNVKVVLGNHDLHFLAVANGSHRTVRKDTLDDLLTASQLPEIIDWMRHLPLIHFAREFECVMVHAGLPPIWTIGEACKYAAEVEHVLRGDNYQGFFDHMYGNLPDVWSDDLDGWDRLRVITNYLTRIRYCTQDGAMELTHKETVTPEGYAPWFSFSRSDNHPILFGHWAAIGGITDTQNMIALDTGCVWGRQLTAYRLNDQQRFSVSATNAV